MISKETLLCLIEIICFVPHIAYLLVVCYRICEWFTLKELYLTKFSTYVFWHGRMGLVTAGMFPWTIIVVVWFTVYKLLG